MASFEPMSPDLVAHIKYCYQAYRHTADLDRKGLFFSPTCLQICRPTPSYAATTRDQIVQYLKDAQEGNVPVETPLSSATEILDISETHEQRESRTKAKSRGVYTIRPLQPSEYEFSTDDVTAPVGLIPAEIKHTAEQEKWIGMRVDLWNEGGDEGGLLVKVQYWWRLEEIADTERVMDDAKGPGWRQCLHDIMYLGPKDGTEGHHGQEVLE
ncbi:uncharacterized protein K460DRAFT_367316 [Cucurbitaria berberidis CBS 394.84]|uniref:SnoaL-like domain-containing protein n=1 Tax=Cucurbitaria berberidis CBS 394.84 TaxID=1168544 RepID=A0A9P4GJ24_9PLEO|nr:uncharacterized protein K460DRAFT_367316 [Cucurbitaria berberidis CBS 394.84]KAF1846557.1 hypothetical protein K460DRAFT_367316 [Cucurbitaria berberidis CBS 394.84]